MAYDHGYGKDWTDVLVYRREGYTTSVADYHRHAYFEVNLIFSGNIHILLPDGSMETTESHIVLMPPGAPHYIACKPDTLYSRQYLSFSQAFLEPFGAHWQGLRQVFGKHGRIVKVNDAQKALCGRLMDGILQERDSLRKSLLILYLLSQIHSFHTGGAAPARPAPAYVTEALSYIGRNYAQKIRAADLARMLHVGRTTLMTAFRQYTGSSLNHYIVRYRLKQAQRLLEEGATVQQTAEACGFGDAGSLIRLFKQVHHTTPGKFARQ